MKEKKTIPLLNVVSLDLMLAALIVALVLFLRMGVPLLESRAAPRNTPAPTPAPIPTAQAAEPAGDPRDTVTGFFDAVIAENYDEAYRYLNGYSTLGLENEPENEVSRQVFDALRRSYSYKLHGDCILNKTHAAQQVLVQHLDLNAFQADLKQATEDALERKVQLLPRSELYDENGGYLPEVTSSAYAEAVAALLARSDDYMTVTGMELELSYSADGWLLNLSSPLTAALSGSTSGKGAAE